MKINLRNADAIQREIDNTIRRTDIHVSIQVTEFEGNGEEPIAKARVKSVEARDYRAALIGVKYEIRGKVAHANVAGGISDFLAEMAAIDESISMLRPIAEQDAKRLDPAILQGKLAKMKAQSAETDRFAYGRDAVATGIYDEADIEDIAARIADLKRQKVKLKNMLLEANISNGIDVSDAGTETLRKAGII